MNIFESVLSEPLEETNFPQFGKTEEGWKYFNGTTVVAGYYKQNGFEWLCIQNQDEKQTCYFEKNQAKVSTPWINDLSQWNEVYKKVTDLIKG